MAVRIRGNGQILCAAMHPALEGDLYIDDALHYYLSVDVRILITEPHELHKLRGEWWWRGLQPDATIIDDFYL